MASVLTRLTKSPLDAAAADALKAYRDLEALPADKLAADHYLREACANGKTDPEKLRKLEERLAAGPQDEEHELVELFLQAAGNAVRHICADPPRTNLHTLLGPGSDPNAFVSVLVAVQMCGTTVLELVALAVWRTVRDDPEAFGERTLPAAEQEQMQNAPAASHHLKCDQPKKGFK